LVSGLGSAFAAGLAGSSDEEDEESVSWPLHRFKASIHFFRSSAEEVAMERFCDFFWSPERLIQYLFFLVSPSSILIPARGTTFDLAAPAFFA